MPNPKSTERLTPVLSKTLLTLLETLPGALFVVDGAATIVYANASAQTMLGATREDILGKPLWRGAPHLVSTALYQAVQQTRQTRAPAEVECVSPMTGTWLHVQLSPTAGGLMVQVHQGRAATRREEPVPQGERLSIEDLDGLFSRIGVLTPEGIVLEINEIPLAQARVRREEVIGHPLAEARWWSCSPTSQAQLRAAIARAGRGETVRFEMVIHSREGMDRYLDVAITPHRDADHHIAYLVIAGIDITERKHAEAEIHALIDAIPQLVWTTQPDGSQDSCNQRWCDYTGLNTEEAQGEGWMQCLHPEDRPRVRSAWQRAVQTGGVYETELRLRQGTTGEYRWFLSRGMPMCNETGQILKWFGTCTDIEEQKRTEQLQAREENWRVLAETVPQLIWTTRADGWVDYMNQRFCDYTHATPEQLQGYGWSQFLHPEDVERALAVRAHAFRTGIPYEAEYRFRDGRTGCYRWFLARGMPVRDDSGQILKWFGTCTDIDEQKQAEQQLKESQESLRVLAETLPQLVWVLGLDGLHEYVNQRWCDYTGLTLEHMQSERWTYLQFIHPDDREENRKRWAYALETGAQFEHEERARNAQTGEYRWFLTRAMPVRDDSGQILKWFGTCTDIDEQKQAEQQLKESQESLRVLAETLPQLVWVIGPDGLYEYVNQRWRDYTGLTLEQTHNDRWAYLQFIHPDEHEGTRANWQHAIDTGTMYEHEKRLRNGQTGEYRWFLTRAIPLRDEGGQIVKWFGTCTDIDEQKRTEEALRESQERANALMNSNIIGITIFEDEQIVDANETFLRMIGSTREDLRAGRLNWMHMTPSDSLARTQQAHQELAAQRSMTPYEKEYVCQDGSRLPVVVGGVLLPHSPRQGIAFVMDNSARKELEQRKDTFISMASHELRNPLAALKLQSQMVRRRLEKRSLQEAATELSRVEMPIKQLERLIGELLDLSKIQAGRLEYIREPVDLDELIQEVADTMQQMYPSHRILVRGAVQASLIGDRDRLGQVFTNLLCNAIKYSPGAETVEMELSASPETVTIRVQDHGPGIPREQRDKIFERFYRVCGPRQRGIPGLGIGLSVVAEIVKHHGGSITVDSEVGTGSTFTVTLPRMCDA